MQVGVDTDLNGVLGAEAGRALSSSLTFSGPERKEATGPGPGEVAVTGMWTGTNWKPQKG